MLGRLGAALAGRGHAGGRAVPYRHDVRHRRGQRHRTPDRPGERCAPAAADPARGPAGPVDDAGDHRAADGGPVVRAAAAVGHGPGRGAAGDDRGLHARGAVGAAVQRRLHRSAQLRRRLRPCPRHPDGGLGGGPDQHPLVVGTDLRRPRRPGHGHPGCRHRRRHHLRADVRPAARLLPDREPLSPLQRARALLAARLGDASARSSASVSRSAVPWSWRPACSPPLPCSWV